jgi:hypothetical protein
MGYEIRTGSEIPASLLGLLQLPNQASLGTESVVYLWYYVNNTWFYQGERPLSDLYLGMSPLFNSEGYIYIRDTGKLQARPPVPYGAQETAFNLWYNINGAWQYQGEKGLSSLSSLNPFRGSEGLVYARDTKRYQAVIPLVVPV